MKIRYLTGWLVAILLTACSDGEPVAVQENSLSLESSVVTGSPTTGEIRDRSYVYLDGTPIDPSDLAGQNVLVNYWATWCAPCIRELPSLIAAADLLQGEAMVLLASDETPDQIQAFIREQGLDATHFVRLDGMFGLNGIQAVPSTSLYDESGKELGNWLGAYEWNSPEILSELRMLMQR